MKAQENLTFEEKMELLDQIEDMAKKLDSSKLVDEVVAERYILIQTHYKKPFV